MRKRLVYFGLSVATLLPAWATLNAAPQIAGGFTQINMQDGGYFPGVVQHWSGRLIGRTDGGGIYSSDNHGYSWNYLSGNMISTASLTVLSVAVPQTTSSSSNLILQAVGNDYSLNDSNRGIWKSIDGGATWVQTLTGVNFWGDGPERVGGECMIFHPTNDSEVWAGSHAQGLYKSIDAGNTWTQMPGFATSNVVASICIHPSFPDQIFVGGNGGLWASVDHGTNWTQIASAPLILRVTRAADGTVYFGGQNGSAQVIEKITSTNWANPASYVTANLSSAYTNGYLANGNALTCLTVLRDGRLVAGDYDNTRISGNAGANFTSLPRAFVAGSPQPQWGSGTRFDCPTCLVQDPIATNTWYGGGGNSPMRTDDGGQHWQYLFQGIGEVVTSKVGFSPTDPNRMYIPCADNGGAVVTDGGISGNTASMLKPFFPGDGIMFSHRALPSTRNGVNRVIFPGGEEFHNQARIYITTNDGTSWYSPAMTGLPTASGQQIIDAVDSLDNPDDFLVVCGGNSGPNLGGVYRTTNAGASFTQCNWYPSNNVALGGAGYHVVSMARDATNVNVRYLYAHAVFPSTPPVTNSGGGMFISNDRGLTWTQETFPFLVPHDWNDWQGTVVADRNISGSIWLTFTTGAAGEYGVLHSYDGGNSWSTNGVSIFTNAIAADAVSGNVVVLGQMTGDTWNKIYYSTNNGTNWSQVTATNYAFGNATGVALDPRRPGSIFISTQERSVGIFTPGTPQQQWQLNYFMSTNSAQAGGGADPNGNGLPNMIEYALGADPLAGLKSDPFGSGSTNGTNFLPRAAISTNPALSGRTVMRVNLPDPPPGDITLQALSSANLINWITNATRTGTNAWVATAPAVVALGPDTNGRAIFDIGVPQPARGGQYQILRVRPSP